MSKIFVTEILDKCTIIRVHNLMPKKLRTQEFNLNFRDGFLLMARDGDRLMALQNLGFDPTEAEKSHLKRYISTWGGGERVNVTNGILEMEFPSFLRPFTEEINNIPGCRISPNLLRIGGDVYLSVEFPAKHTKKINQIVIDFILEDHLFSKDLVYSGSQTGSIPMLLRMYKEAGNSLKDFTMISTVWNIEKTDRKEQNLGVFTNEGSYVPKAFINDSEDMLIFRKTDREITGFSEYQVVDGSENLVEFKVRSKFFSDFYNLVIRNYSGPIFMHPVVNGTGQITYYIVESSHLNLFFTGLHNHWSMQSRKEHINYIGTVEQLDLVVKRLEMDLAKPILRAK